MGKIDLINDSWSDLVFEGKNQAYGAYQLRRETGKRNLWSLLTMFAIAVIIALVVFINGVVQNAMKSNVAVETDIELSALEQKKEEAKVERKEQPQIEKVEVEKVKSSVKFTAPEIKKDDEVKPEEEIKSQEDLSKTNTAIGAFDVKGNDEAAGEVLKAKEVIAQPEPPKEEETKVFDVVERDGSITDVRVVRSVDPSLDKEAIRVVKSMPKWIAGKQNGAPVRVKFTLPVSFRLQ